MNGLAFKSKPHLEISPVMRIIANCADSLLRKRGRFDLLIRRILFLNIMWHIEVFFKQTIVYRVLFLEIINCLINYGGQRLRNLVNSFIKSVYGMRHILFVCFIWREPD